MDAEAPCRTGKTMYPSCADAARVVRKLLGKRKFGAKTLCKPYKCPSCGRWHVTSHPTWASQGRSKPRRNAGGKPKA